MFPYVFECNQEINKHLFSPKHYMKNLTCNVIIDPLAHIRTKDANTSGLRESVVVYKLFINFFFMRGKCLWHVVCNPHFGTSLKIEALTSRLPSSENKDKIHSLISRLTLLGVPPPQMTDTMCYDQKKCTSRVDELMGRKSLNASPEEFILHHT